MANTLNQTPTFPRWVPAVHLTAVALIQSTQTATMFILPVLARREFNASNWQTVLITATPTVLFVLSIFWNDFFRRSTMTRYMWVYWLLACLPPVFIAFATQYWMLLVPHMIACIGGAGYHPAAGELFKRLYSDKRRGRMYGLVTGVQMSVGAAAGFGIGEWLNFNTDAFRYYMPIASLLQLLGVVVMIWLARETESAPSHTPAPPPHRWAATFEPILHMREVLRGDPIFYRYEVAYMTYGIGWMIAFALLPLIVTDSLKLRYDQVAESTHVAYLLAMVAMLVPAGWLLDHLGAIRSAGLSFLALALYPLGLIVAHTPHQLMAASVVYGIAHAGASVGWMLGPVSLAPNPQKVPHYVAIHATLVGLRGTLFQGLGVLLYSMTGSFTLPLAVAAGAYIWAAVLMWKLHQRIQFDKSVRANEARTLLGTS